MILPLEIDTSSLASQFDLDQNDVDNLLEGITQGVTAAILHEWTDQANSQLGKSRQQYTNSLILGEEGRFTNTITLVGQVPNMIEQGAEPFDIKKGFENSDKKVAKKDGVGWYLTIPFSFASPGALGESTKFSGILPSEVKAALVKKSKDSPGASLSLSDIPDEFKIPKQRSEIKLFNKKVIPAYENKNSIYEGIKSIKEAKSGSSQVMSFRRVSDNSESNAFMHPGISPRRFADKAIDSVDIPQLVGDITDGFLDQL